MIARFCTRYALVGFVALAIAVAAKPAAPANPTPASLLIAKQIMDIKGVSAVFAPLVRGVIEKVRQQALQTNFMWAKDINEVAANLQKDYASRANELIDTTARIYAQHFTEAELKDMLTFYQSPLGQKIVVEEPKVLDESMSQAGQWGDKLAEEIIVKMRAEMKKRGHDL